MTTVHRLTCAVCVFSFFALLLMLFLLDWFFSVDIGSNTEKASSLNSHVCKHMIHNINIATLLCFWAGVTHWIKGNREKFLIFLYPRLPDSNLRSKERHMLVHLYGNLEELVCGTIQEEKTCWTAARPSTISTRPQMGNIWLLAPLNRSSTGSCWRVRSAQTQNGSCFLWEIEL